MHLVQNDRMGRLYSPFAEWEPLGRSSALHIINKTIEPMLNTYRQPKQDPKQSPTAITIVVKGTSGQIVIRLEKATYENVRAAIIEVLKEQDGTYASHRFVRDLLFDLYDEPAKFGDAEGQNLTVAPTSGGVQYLTFTVNFTTNELNVFGTSYSVFKHLSETSTFASLVQPPFTGLTLADLSEAAIQRMGFNHGQHAFNAVKKDAKAFLFPYEISSRLLNVGSWSEVPVAAVESAAKRRQPR